MRPHYSEGWLKEANKRVKQSSHKCDCWKYEHQVCDICQGVVGKKLMDKPAYSPYRSKLEAAWANYLTGLRYLGTITGFWYEPMNLRLPGMKNFYKPDFLVMDAERQLTFYEVKGRNKSDDRSLVKIKTAAGVTPWAKFVLVKRIGGQWEERTIV